MNTQTIVPVVQKALTPDVVEGLPLLDLACRIQVKDDDSLRRANEVLLQAATALKRIDGIFDPGIDLANKAHKFWTQTKKTVSEPFLKAKELLSPKIRDYMADLDRKRRDAEAKAREEADRLRGEAEDRLLVTAAAAEDAGLKHHAEQLLETKVVVKPVPVAVPPAPKLPGSYLVHRWKWKVVNEAEVPREYLTVDVKKVAEVFARIEAEVPREYLTVDVKKVAEVFARIRENMKISGIEVYPDTDLNTRVR